mgnify:CR=1 FL=1|tara:strand:+ start:2153 stop:2959 length:807 start_codon:yes stop_codon:yes gene_type:complete
MIIKKIIASSNKKYLESFNNSVEIVSQMSMDFSNLDSTEPEIEDVKRHFNKITKKRYYTAENAFDDTCKAFLAMIMLFKIENDYNLLEKHIDSKVLFFSLSIILLSKFLSDFKYGKAQNIFEFGTEIALEVPEYFQRYKAENICSVQVRNSQIGILYAKENQHSLAPGTFLPMFGTWIIYNDNYQNTTNKDGVPMFNFMFKGNKYAVTLGYCVKENKLNIGMLYLLSIKGNNKQDKANVKYTCLLTKNGIIPGVLTMCEVEQNQKLVI